jgi:uncharacterized protein
MNMATNYFRDLKHFMERWDHGSVVITKNPNLKIGKYGNINLDGTPDCYEAKSFVKGDRGFNDSIERGVRELVLLLIEKLGCITYSSCQGHPACDAAPMRERHVGIIPRNALEYLELLQHLQNAKEFTNSSVQPQSVRVAIYEAILDSDDCSLPCFDIFFISTNSDKRNYFDDLDVVYHEFITHCANCF